MTVLCTNKSGCIEVNIRSDSFNANQSFNVHLTSIEVDVLELAIKTILENRLFVTRLLQVMPLSSVYHFLGLDKYYNGSLIFDEIIVPLFHLTGNDNGYDSCENSDDNVITLDIEGAEGSDKISTLSQFVSNDYILNAWGSEKMLCPVYVTLTREGSDRKYAVNLMTATYAWDNVVCPLIVRLNKMHTISVSDKLFKCLRELGNFLGKDPSKAKFYSHLNDLFLTGADPQYSKLLPSLFYMEYADVVRSVTSNVGVELLGDQEDGDFVTIVFSAELNDALSTLSTFVNTDTELPNLCAFVDNIALELEMNDLVYDAFGSDMISLIVNKDFGIGHTDQAMIESDAIISLENVHGDYTVLDYYADDLGISDRIIQVNYMLSRSDDILSQIKSAIAIKSKPSVIIGDVEEFTEVLLNHLRHVRDLIQITTSNKQASNEQLVHSFTCDKENNIPGNRSSIKSITIRAIIEVVQAYGAEDMHTFLISLSNVLDILLSTRNVDDMRKYADCVVYLLGHQDFVDMILRLLDTVVAPENKVDNAPIKAGVAKLNLG